MKWIKPSWRFLAVSVPLGFQLAAIPTLATQMQIQSSPNTKTWQISQFTPPPRGEVPPSVGAATRGGTSYINGDLVLTSLMPTNKLGLTFTKNPTFFWYVSSPSIKSAQFTLLNDSGNEVVYETTLTLPNKPGIISLTLPTNMRHLEVGQTYHWYFTLISNNLDFSGNPRLDGWVKRIEPEASMSEKLKNTELNKLPNVYAKAGIWQEALKSLADLRRNDPNNYQANQDWQKLLKSVNLSAIASQPIIDCCTPENHQQ